MHDAQDKLRSEALRFLFPVGQEGGRSHNQSRQTLQPAFSPQCVQPRNSLKGFSQPHIISQAGAETPFRNPVKEREPFFLVRAHQGVQPGRKLRYGDWDFPRQDVQGLPEVLSRFHDTVFVRFRNLYKLDGRAINQHSQTLDQRNAEGAHHTCRLSPPVH